MPSNTSATQHRILVIDDNAAIHEDFRKILQQAAPLGDELLEMESELFDAQSQSSPSAGFVIDSAFQGREGLEMVRLAKNENRPYVLAFVDGRMPPGWDGIETIGRLWEVDPELQVVFCTAYADYSWQEIQRSLGTTDGMVILKKPFDTVEVLQLVHTLARKWELNRQVHGRLKDLNNLVQQSIAEKEQAWAFLESAVEHCPAGIVISDARSGRIRKINSAALTIYGLTEPATPRIADRDPDSLIQSFQSDGTPYPVSELPLHRAMRQGETVRDVEYVIHTAQGRERWIVANAAPVLDPNGGIAAGILVFHDITPRKEAEKEATRMQNLLNQAQKMETMGILAGGVAHGFNNLLQAMRSNLELAIKSESLGSREADRLRTVIRSLERAATLVRQLLLFSRKVEFTKVRVDVNREVGEVLQILERAIPRMISLEPRLDPSVWAIAGDPMQIEQILLNLANNAVDAMPEGGILTVTTSNVVLDEDFVRGHPGSKGGRHTLLTVTDTGHGMDEATLKHVFDPFFTTKEVGQGTGLGLPSVYGIVTAHGGYIHCTSEPGRGTVFLIYLPAVDIGVPATEEPEPFPRGGEETILVVDDEPEIRELSQEALEDLGYTVLSAPNGEEALKIYREHGQTIDLVLLDLNMPGMGGLKCLRELVRLDPTVKVIIASGYAANVHAEDTLSDGAKAYLAKPYRLRELAAAVREVLEAKGDPREE